MGDAAAGPRLRETGESMTAIRLVRRSELEALREIEREAGRGFAAIGMAEIAAAEPLAVADLEGLSGRRPRLGRCRCVESPGRVPAQQHRRWLRAHRAGKRRRRSCAARAGRLADRLAAISAADGRPALTLTT